MLSCAKTNQTIGAEFLKTDDLIYAKSNILQASTGTSCEIQ
jgi:hypothetical protein